VAVRIELIGRLRDHPQLRVTPSGAALLILNVDCGEAGEEMPMRVVVKGEMVRQLHPNLHIGNQIRAEGRLHCSSALAARNILSGLEVIAETVGIGHTAADRRS
jgi:primosomal replication protein N